MGITRIKDGGAGDTGGAYLRYNAGFDTSDIPTAPTSPPIDPNEGDVLIELFSNDYTVNIRAIIYWEHNGTNWIQVGEVEYNTIHITEEASGTLDYGTPPTAPVNHAGNESITYVPGDTLHEEFGNGYVTWVCDGAVWTFVLMRIYTSTQIYHYTSFDTSAVPIAPTTVPLYPSIDNTIIEKFDNLAGNERVTLVWKYDGADWIQVGHPEYHPMHFFDVVGANVNVGSPPLTPANFGVDVETTYIPGDTLWEDYNDGFIYWEVDSGGTWQIGSMVVYPAGGGGGSGITTSIGVVASFNNAAVPTAPTVAPSSPVSGDVYIETFNNTTGNQRVIMRWEYNGTIWVLNGVAEYNIRSFHAVVGSSINILSLPATPATPGASTDYITGDILREEYSNGYIDWVYATSSWTLRHARLVAAADTNNKTTLSHQTSFDTSSVPTTPVSSPGSPITGDVHVETFDNTTGDSRVVQRWTYNGTTWVINGTPEYNLKRYFATVASNLTAGALPSTPATPGSSTGYVTGDTLLETYNNGHLEWTYGTSSWTLSASRINTNRVSIIKGTGNWDEDGTLPTTPDSPPSSPLINDIIIQSYDNATRNNAVTRYWTYNGTSWVELTNGIHRFNMVFTNVPGTSLTYGGTPTAALAATTTSYVNGDILWEKYTNGYGLYKFNNGSWSLETHGLEVGRIQDSADFQATLGPGVDGYYIVYDHSLTKFTLSAT